MVTPTGFEPAACALPDYLGECHVSTFNHGVSKNKPFKKNDLRHRAPPAAFARPNALTLAGQPIEIRYLFLGVVRVLKGFKHVASHGLNIEVLLGRGKQTPRPAGNKTGRHIPFRTASRNSERVRASSLMHPNKQVVVV